MLFFEFFEFALHPLDGCLGSQLQVLVYSKKTSLCGGGLLKITPKRAQHDVPTSAVGAKPPPPFCFFGDVKINGGGGNLHLANTAK